MPIDVTQLRTVRLVGIYMRSDIPNVYMVCLYTLISPKTKERTLLQYRICLN